MSDNINYLNKQIASFMLVSLALSVPVSAQAFSSDNNLLADASLNMPNMTMIEVQHPMMRYAAPHIPYAQDPIPQPVPVPPAISMYAAPQHPIIEPHPIIEHPIISMYAAPEYPIIEHPHPGFHVIEPIEQPLLEEMQNKPIMNESSVNLNNLNGMNQQSNLQSSLNKINSMGINANKAINAVNMNVKTDGFVPSQFGNVRIIEPYAHFVFK